VEELGLKVKKRNKKCYLRKRKYTTLLVIVKDSRLNNIFFCPRLCGGFLEYGCFE